MSVYIELDFVATGNTRKYYTEKPISQHRLCSDTVLVKTLKVKTVAHHRGPVVKLKLTERLDTVVALRF